MITDPLARKLIDSLETGVILLDPLGRLTAMNVAAEALLATSRRQVLGQQLAHLLPDCEELIQAVHRARESGTTLTERNFSLPASAGTSLVDCTITPLLDSDEVLLELSNIERHQRIAREGSMLAQSTLSIAVMQGLAHEVKNPLGGIRGAAQLLERELVDEAQREYTRIIVGEVDRLRHLIDKMIQPASPAKPVRMNVHEALEHVRELVKAEIGMRAHIAVDYDPSLPEIEAVRDDLVQVFLNLLRNAVEALEDDGQVSIRSRAQRLVTIGGKQFRLCLRIEVCDNGRGVPQELQESLFFPMVTGRAEGTGLGLAIAQNIIQRLGGMIEFESEPGNTCFIVFIPVPETEQVSA